MLSLEREQNLEQDSLAIREERLVFIATLVDGGKHLDRMGANATMCASGVNAELTQRSFINTLLLCAAIEHTEKLVGVEKMVFELRVEQLLIGIVVDLDHRLRGLCRSLDSFGHGGTTHGDISLSIYLEYAVFAVLSGWKRQHKMT